MKPLNRRDFAHPHTRGPLPLYTLKCTHVHHSVFFPTDMGGLLKDPRGFKVLCEAPLHRVLFEVSFFVRNCMKCPDLKGKVIFANPQPKGVE